MPDFGNVGVTPLLMNAMRVASLNHRLIANNIANADTPNFDPARLDFQATLQRTLNGQEGVALRTTHRRHLGKTVPRPDFEALALLSKNDYNKVDLDEQMAALSENTSNFNVYARLLGRNFQRTRTMISDLRA